MYMPKPFFNLEMYVINTHRVGTIMTVYLNVPYNELNFNPVRGHFKRAITPNVPSKFNCPIQSHQSVCGQYCR